MADNKPTILSMTPWDANNDYNIRFSYSGNLPVSNRMIIYDAGSLQLVYDQVQQGSQPYHTISANTLRNGAKYAAQMTVTDNNGITSVISSKVYFWCFETPAFYYTRPMGENITIPSVTLEVFYSQSDGEQLYSYQHFLYDNTHTQIAQSDIFYTLDNLSYTFNGLANKAGYYLRTVGKTKNGIPLDTNINGEKRIFINYDEEDEFAFLTLKSDINGTVTGNTNMISINADEDDDDYVFLNSYVQLIDREVNYTTNFNIEGDFTLSLKLTQLMFDGTLLLMSNGNSTIRLTSNIYEGQIVYRLIVNNTLTEYNIFAGPMTLLNNDVIVIHIRRVKNLYKLVVQKVT